jgi:tetratricopeptide (TPR) repeat protein
MPVSLHIPSARLNRQDWVLCALLFAGSAATGLTPVADGDVYWHMAAGREMVRTGALLQSDAFSVSAAGRPWIDVHWLFQLAVFGLHQLGGLPALVYAKCFLIGSGALCLYAALPRTARALFVPLCIGVLFCARHLLLVRPVIVTLLCVAFFFVRLERFRADRAATALIWQLPLAQIVWSNCQGLFALGPALVGAYLVGAVAWLRLGQQGWFPFAAEGGGLSRADGTADRHGYARMLALTLLLCMAGSLATPYGLRALGLPIQLLLRLVPHAQNPYQNVAENLPPFLLERFSAEQVWHLKWFLGLLALGVLCSAGRMLLSHLLMLLGMVGLALLSHRNVLLLYWLASPIVALQLAPAARRVLVAVQSRRVLCFARGLPLVASAGVLGVVCTAAARESSFREPSPFHIPVDAVRAVEDVSGSGTVFTADHQGGYLIWKLYPRFKPYIDTRLVLRTADEYAEYLELADHPDRFQAFQQRHGFSYVVLPVLYPDRYLGLIALLYDSPEWNLIYTDGSDVVFARSTLVSTANSPGEQTEQTEQTERVDLRADATTDRLTAQQAARFHDSPRLLEAARIQLATLDIAVHAFGQAERVLSESSSTVALALRARARLAAGDLEGTEQLAERLMRDDDRDVRTLDLLALLHVRRGQLPKALTFVRRALAIDPFDSEATRLLGTMEEMQP